MEHSIYVSMIQINERKTEFVESIVSDVEWLGAKYDGDIKFASNYFDQMYEAAVLLIKKRKSLCL